MPHRRITLGSGLNPGKTADTIRHLRESDQRVSLILDSGENEHGWIHLRRVPPQDNDGSPAAWLLVIGYAGFDQPTDHFSQAIPEALGDAQLTEWKQGFYARFQIDDRHDAPALARLLRTVMLDLQGVTDEASIRVALEYD